MPLSVTAPYLACLAQAYAGNAQSRIVQAFFEEFGRKVARLPGLFASSFCDEAFTLCIVYIDRLASGRYGGGAGRNRENFCRALRELSGVPLFAMLHPCELVEQTEQKFPDALPLVKSIVEKAPGALLGEAVLARAIQNSSLDPSIKGQLIANLWRASIASICYSHLRRPEIHGPGSGGLSFDETIYDGQKGVTVDFPMMYSALRGIHEQIKAISVQTGNWFGNPNYFFTLRV